MTGSRPPQVSMVGPDRLICLVSDRHRLVRVMGAHPAEGPALILAQVKGAVAAGLDYVQIRERDLDAASLVRLMRDAIALARGSRTQILVNDRPDVAIAAAAAGVHLREDSPRPAVVRQLLPAGMVLGRSVHHPDGLADAAGADYFLVGSVFDTASKTPGHPRLGLGGLRSLVVLAGRVPVVAIGGVTTTEVGAVLRTGAAGIAAIGAFLPPTPADDPATTVRRVADALRKAFDGVDPVS